MKHLSFSELSLYIDGELDDEKKKEIEAHLAVCDKCRKELALLKGIDDIIIEKSPDWVVENFLDSLELTKKKKRFGITLKKLALGFLVFLILSLPVLGILRTTYEEKVNKEFQVLIEEHKTIGIEGVVPVKW